MQVGVIGLGNIGGHVAANLVTDGHDVVVFDVDARARRRRSTGARAVASVAEVGAASEVTVLSLPDAGGRAPGRRRVGDDRSVRSRARRPLDQQSRGRARARRASSPSSGHHLVEAPLTGGAIGAQNRMLVVHGRRRRRRRRPRAAGARTTGPRLRAPGPARPRQHHEAGQQPHRLHHHVGEPRGPVAGGEVGDPGAAGRRGAAHQRRRQLLPRPHGREHRHPQRAPRSSLSGWRPRTPASSSRPGAPLGVPTPAGARRCCRCSWARSRPVSATTTGATSSPPPSARATSSSTGTPDPPDHRLRH